MGRRFFWVLDVILGFFFTQRAQREAQRAQRVFWGLGVGFEGGLV